MNGLDAMTIYGLTGQQQVCPLKMETLSCRPGGQTRSESIAETARMWIGKTFFGMLLSEMRRTIPKDGMFSGGRAEEVFQQMADQTLAEEFAKRSDIPITQELIRQLGGAVRIGNTGETEGTGGHNDGWQA